MGASRSDQVLGVNITFFILSSLAVILRVYVRAFMIKQLGIDDWLMGLAHVLYMVYLCFQAVGIAHGTGQHLGDVPESSYVIALKAWFFCELFYILSATIVKVSIGFFLLRITVRPIHVWILRLLIVATACVGSAYFLFALLQCPHHIPSWWTIKREGCIAPYIVVDVSYAAASGNALADWAFGILPIFIVWDLNMSTRTKFIAGGILSFAAIGSIGTLIRMAYVKTLGEIPDFLYVTTDFAVWSTIEVGVAIVAGCAATLRPLLKVILQKLDIKSSHLRNTSSWQSPGARQGYMRDMDLPEMRPDKSVTTTTVATGDAPRRSKSHPKSPLTATNPLGGASDEDLIQVNQSIVVTYDSSHSKS